MNSVGRAAEILAGVCLGVGFANLILFGYYLNLGKMEWGYYYIAIVLHAVFIIYWAVQTERRKGQMTAPFMKSENK